MRVALDAQRREVLPIVEHADGEFLRLFGFRSAAEVAGRSFVSLLLGAATDVGKLLLLLHPFYDRAHGEAAAPLLDLYDSQGSPIRCRVTSRRMDRPAHPLAMVARPAAEVEAERARGHYRLLLVTPECFWRYCKDPGGLLLLEQQQQQHGKS